MLILIILYSSEIMYIFDMFVTKIVFFTIQVYTSYYFCVRQSSVSHLFERAEIQSGACLFLIIWTRVFYVVFLIEKQQSASIKREVFALWFLIQFNDFSSFFTCSGIVRVYVYLCSSMWHQNLRFNFIDKGNWNNFKYTLGILTHIHQINAIVVK